MISRYESKNITAIWSEENKFKTFLKIEIELLRALELKQIIPNGTTHTIESTVKISPKRI